MNTEHTKGPWIANGKYVTAPHEGHVCVMRPIDTRLEAIDHANARLIAAAPELLKACMACLESGQLTPLTPNVIRMVRAAINKATA